VPTNTAAWIDHRTARLRVRPAPATDPGPGEVVVRNHAVAVNPLDWVIQLAGTVAYRWLRYPTVLGSDVAGEVVAVGPDVTRVRVGDRVLAHTVGTDRDRDRAAEGGFQERTVVLERLTCPVPDDLPAEDACVLPLALSTAACALFQTRHLALRHPRADPGPTGETVLVWGGATSVGLNAVQLARAAGYDVVATASPRHADLLRSLGAHVVDRTAPTAAQDVAAALAGRTLAGAVAVGEGSGAACVEAVRTARGRRSVALTSTPVSFAPLADGGRAALPRLLLRIAASTAALQVRALRSGVRARFVIGSSLKADEVAAAVYRDFLPAALAEGRYRALPRPLVVGTGLEAVQEAIDVQRRGVSARKVVVSLTPLTPR
jgi:NADPH:quinone reductase-like Zn-dependent oxidoreductase